MVSRMICRTTKKFSFSIVEIPGALSSGYRVADEIAEYSDGNRLSSNSVQWFVASVILVILQAH